MNIGKNRHAKVPEAHHLEFAVRLSQHGLGLSEVAHLPEELTHVRRELRHVDAAVAC